MDQFRRTAEWSLGFAGRSREGRRAAQVGLDDWDRKRAAVSEDLLDWRPLGDSL